MTRVRKALLSCLFAIGMIGFSAASVSATPPSLEDPIGGGGSGGGSGGGGGCPTSCYTGP
ncbi:hypothetical protein GCM10008967_09550 [Bacillus carboniphilus]|uniref:Uncharacterized protein n=1 Tax=Bacillus carboniphilus TaxID=86663 RepID=A0ABN0VZB9_9BACI